MIDKFYTQTITILTKSSTADSYNQKVITWASGTTFVGIINPLNGNEVYASQKRNIISTHALFCPPSVPLTINNRISVDGKQYEVTFVSNPMTMSMFLKIYLRLLE